MAWCLMYLLKSTACYVRTYHLCVSCGFYSISGFVFVTDKEFVPGDIKPEFLLQPRVKQAFNPYPANVENRVSS
jgi:hypothetical protein